MKLEYDPLADAAYFAISDTEVAETRQIEPGIFADYDANGHLVGIEVLSVRQRETPMPVIPPKAA